MSIIGSDLIKSMCKSKILPLIGKADPVQIKGVIEGSSYDLHIAAMFEVGEQPFLIGVKERRSPAVREVMLSQDGTWGIEAGSYHLIKTVEELHVPAHLIGRVKSKVTLQTDGLLLLYTDVAPGYSGVLTLGLKEVRGGIGFIEEGARIASIVFHTITGEADAYDGPRQGGKSLNTGKSERPY
jgi:deoxycytidine triphosphate deaminase